MSPTSLSDWRTEFGKLDACPWPGPRPLENDDVHVLCGRDEDVTNFLNEVEASRVVFLTGYSGVGKTSLLQRGLVPKLRSRGFVVAVCRDWSGAADEDDVATFLANRVSGALEGSVEDLPTDATVMRTLALEYGDRAVLILDQFEELIRDARAFTKKLFEALASLVKFSKIKVVISLRMEQLHEMRQLEHLLPPFASKHFYLEEVEDRFISNVVDAGNVTARAKFHREAITPSVAGHVKEWWDRAKNEDDLRKEVAPGLLGLQGLLHVLDDRAAGNPVGEDVWSKLLAELNVNGGTADDAARLFALTLSESAEVKLRRCRTASEKVGLDAYLIEGATSVLSRTVPHMTSAGYKLVRNVWELAGLALEDELVLLRHGAATSRAEGCPEDGYIRDEQERTLFDVIMRSILADDDHGGAGGDAPSLDALTSTRREFSQEADRMGGDVTTIWVNRLHETESPFDADPEEVTSGPLLGRSPTEAMIEEYRRFALAMEWLRMSHLVRFNTPMAGVVMVALIHDGFGVALKRWSLEKSQLPVGPLHAVTASGQSYRWTSDKSSFLPEFDGTTDGEPRLIVNLRWRGSSFVDSGFRRVQFVNCDLRGALFSRCVFDGVSFVNCLLDGLMFSDCQTLGTASPRPKRYSDGPTPFMISRSTAAAAQIAAYRVDREGDRLLSDLPGFPAVPASNDESIEMLDTEPGSLVIRGGRTASLSVRAMTFGPGASFCLRDSAGSGFDVIEHRSAATYEISGCVLRHVTFTTPPHTAETAEPLIVTAWGSALYQTWIGDDLKGSFTASDCTLLSVWNGSPPENFEAVAVDGSQYHDIVAIEPDETCKSLVPDERLRSVKDLDRPTKGRLVEMSRLMDYRRSVSDELAPGTGPVSILQGRA